MQFVEKSMVFVELYSGALVVFVVIIHDWQGKSNKLCKSCLHVVALDSPFFEGVYMYACAFV